MAMLHLLHTRAPDIIVHRAGSQLKMSERQTKTVNQEHSLTLSFTHSRHSEQLLFSCLCSKVTLSLSHSLTFTLSLSHSLTLTLTLTRSHSLSLDLLNNFCFHV